MRKLILIPTIVLTCLLALSFALPGEAHGMFRAVAPSLHLNLPSVFSAASVGSPVTAGTNRTQNSTARPTSVGGASTSLTASEPSNQSDPSSPAVQDTHDVATTGHSNCGRFGNGFHGGKHLLVCPNRPFPGAVNSHT